MAAVIYSVIDSSNIVVNTIMLDESLVGEWLLPEGQAFGPNGGSIGQFWNGASYEDVIVAQEYDLATEVNKKIAALWKHHNTKLDTYTITVSISGTPTPFGTDPTTRENVVGINALIDKEINGLIPPGSIANPRPFTPKGQMMPVMVSHSEFAMIGLTMAYAKDIHYVAYALHKIALLSLGSVQDVIDYDITVGWPT